MWTISKLAAHPDWTLEVTFEDGYSRVFNMKPFLDYEAFTELKDVSMFLAVRNAGYFVEWPNGADLSADTLRLEGQPA